jgi:hypothetical protein
MHKKLILLFICLLLAAPESRAQASGGNTTAYIVAAAVGAVFVGVVAYLVLRKVYSPDRLNQKQALSAFDQGEANLKLQKYREAQDGLNLFLARCRTLPAPDQAGLEYLRIRAEDYLKEIDFILAGKILQDETNRLAGQMTAWMAKGQFLKAEREVEGTQVKVKSFLSRGAGDSLAPALSPLRGLRDVLQDMMDKLRGNQYSTLQVQKDYDSIGIQPTIDQYLDFLDKYPPGPYADSAKFRVKLLRSLNTNSEYELALRANTISVFQQFLLLYPGTYDEAVKAMLEPLYRQQVPDTAYRIADLEVLFSDPVKMYRAPLDSNLGPRYQTLLEYITAHRWEACMEPLSQITTFLWHWELENQLSPRLAKVRDNLIAKREIIKKLLAQSKAMEPPAPAPPVKKKPEKQP